MKIAFVCPFLTLNSTNGVISQAKSWKKGLELLGHQVTLVDMWNIKEWGEFDIIHFFTLTSDTHEFIGSLSKINPNIVISPILDPDYGISRLKIYARWGCPRLRFNNRFNSVYQAKRWIKLFFVRSNFEKDYIVKGYGIAPELCKVVRLSYDDAFIAKYCDKEMFVLHVSLLTDKRKNVARLIDASKKYKFPLTLAGRVRNKKELTMLNSWIGDVPWIKYVGMLSNNDLVDMYSRARVFALPSTNEGVGIVAIEAAAMGCDIVITSIGGPKEYYENMAKAVNPYNIDDIGMAIMSFIEKGETFQPKLSEYVKSNYSLLAIAKQIEEAYNSIL